MTSQQLADVTWDKNAPPATMSRRELEGINTAMLTLTSLVFVARIAIRLSKRRTFELQDFFCCLSYLFYVAMLVMFFKENDPLYRAERVQRGEAPLYPGLLHDAGMVYRWLTAGQLLYYSSLTAVKLSLLALYRLLLNKASPKYNIMWWAILAFCVLSYVGSAMTTIFVCDDQKAKYNYGMCAKPDEQKRAQFSLWFAYAVDVAGDLAVMFLPFRMTWNLRLPRAQKLGIFILFGSGWICIVFATLRVVQVSVKDGLPKIPDPKWLQMWTVIETSMAVIIGCAPAFNALRRRSEHHNVEITSVGLDIETADGGHTMRAEPYMRVLRTNEQGSEEALHPRSTPGLAF
ncbi:uncharacterized protein J4E92_007380 [Alternaria infectoria]|uniref:uncharacterized protein n=1 Tax=Alternaria infectoria TaxID=45303 RepID=UPI00221EEA0A|nr:uncharacterized protein J4E92_007380 [Alternaria infectoria]KAI4924299.1 hypothetical protein J4E92_007380 [Alternaria infectoria]